MKRLLIILTILLTACQSNTSNSTDNSSKKGKALRQQIDSIYKKAFKPNEPGVAVLISYDNRKVVAQGYGLRNIKTQQPITPNTNMEIASASKQFTALAILSLVDDGKLSLSDTVSQFLAYESFKNVTIEQLINHTSGLADAEAYFYENWDPSKVATNQDVINWYAKKDRKVDEPGKNFHYNDGTYEVLPVIVEKVSGKDYAAYLKENVFKLAGMNSSVAYNLNDPVNIKERAHYYQADSLGNWIQQDGHPLTGLFGAGGIYTSLNDYFNYDKALRERAMFSDSIHQLIFKPSSTYRENDQKKQYAMGWHINDSLAEHYGGWYGVNSLTRHYLDRPLTLAFFANRNDLFEKDLIHLTDSIARNYLEQEQLED